MKTRSMTALAAVTLLLVTMPGLAAAAKPDPQLTLAPNSQNCPAFLGVDATWVDVKGPEAYISLVALVRYDNTTEDAGSGIQTVANDGGPTGVWSVLVDAAPPGAEWFVQGELVRKNGNPITSGPVDTDWFACPA